MFLEKRRRRRARFVDETSSDDIRYSSPEDCFKRDVFYALLDCVIENMARRFEAAKDLEATFGVIWRYSTLDREETREKARLLCMNYNLDVSHDLLDELAHLKAIHAAILGQTLTIITT